MTKKEYLKKAAECEARAAAESAIVLALIVAGCNVSSSEAFIAAERAEARRCRMLAKMPLRERNAYNRGEL